MIDLVDWTDTNPYIWELAEDMAIEVNGGSWEDYAEHQKRGWYLKAAWSCHKFSVELDLA